MLVVAQYDFISEHDGQMNPQVVFPYEVNGKSEQITKPFSFNVLPDDWVIGTNSSNTISGASVNK